MQSAVRTFGVVAMLALATHAQAATITVGANSSTSFEILWSQMVGTTELTALGEFDVAVADTFVDFSISLTNDTALSTERVHAIGFNTDPNGTRLTNTLVGSYFGGFGLNRTFPGFQRIDVCAWGSQNCAGGSQGSNIPGLGTSDSFGFRLLGNFSEGITLEEFAIKFQGDLGSFEFEGELPPVVPPPASVPEPASLLLMSVGIAAAALGAHKRRAGR